MNNDNVLMEFFVQEANACKQWIAQTNRKQFEEFYTRVLNNLREMGLVIISTAAFYDVPLRARLEELDRLEKEHRIELEAAFMAVWLSKDMKSERDALHKKTSLKMLDRK